ncbi:hypothetical protein BJY04DRAFT_215903 [Aspergillus karnatakaensis]|uniref:uncharacterized protein n=1 Tax=Aspergillus karnatakaensis TaxID=1810916 RepID=UPI003CCDC3DC
MTSKSLPPEIIMHIVSFLGYRLAPYASVSKQWQAIVEKHSFRMLFINQDQFSDFARIVTPERQHNIEILCLTVNLPQAPYAALMEKESPEDLHRDNQVFTDTIVSLLRILSGWPDHYATRICLIVGAHSLTDYRDAPEEKQRPFHLGDRHYWQLEQSYLDILGPLHDIPAVPAIERLVIQGGEDNGTGERYIAPAVVSKLSPRLPKLLFANIYLWDNERMDHSLRNGLRNDFACSLSQWPATLKELYLTYVGDAPLDPCFPLLIRSTPGNDPLCLSLHNLSLQLISLTLYEIMIGPELFWPSQESTTGQRPQIWPLLTSLNVTYTLASPSGEWFFDRDPMWPPTSPRPDTYDSDDSGNTEYMPALQDRYKDCWRTRPVHTMANQLYRAAGKAAQNMPKLKLMVLAPQLSYWAYGRRHGKIRAAGHWFMYERIAGESKRGRAIWAGSAEFHPEKDVCAIWKEVGRRHENMDTVIQNEGYLECMRPMAYRDHCSEEGWKQKHGFHLWDG